MISDFAHKVILSLGSNMGDRSENLRHAVSLMSDALLIKNVVISDFFENPAMLPEDSPEEWNLDFLNIALSAETNLPILEFLKKIQQIEIDCGRVNVLRWSPRVIDIDIIFFDDLVMESDICTIPHKDALSRMFVMLPLLQVAKNYKYPKNNEFFGKTVEEIYNKLYNTEI